MRTLALRGRIRGAGAGPRAVVEQERTNEYYRPRRVAVPRVCGGPRAAKCRRRWLSEGRDGYQV